MSVTLIHVDERHTWTDEDSKAGFIFRRPTSRLQREIQAKHTKKGDVDSNAVVDEMLEWAILDWFGFVDHTGVPVTYNKEYLGQVPEVIKSRFVVQFYAASPDKAELGN